jgi:hypothetical protein
MIALVPVIRSVWWTCPKDIERRLRILELDLPSPSCCGTVIGPTPVANPDNGLFYYWIPYDGDVDPVSGDVTIQGEWVLTPFPPTLIVAVENEDNGLSYIWVPRSGDIDPVSGNPTIQGEWQVTAFPPVVTLLTQDPDSGLLYEWVPSSGDIDPVSGMPTIQGEWILTTLL